ncbi:hypothetical protein [Leptothoe sp. PORK10 BA2]|uniref:hypothetical protein n=1 Tax=Leptothoe sp. PORK10 BA2 TaxID=3110254 RepID=UPI002B2105E9|nr:hypothetical protein [Leptothoe sp. PORK10 BA2]MEA5462495.1 hypothetical protein [Leptothoe sp. PORK10 BA2]
MASWLKVVGMGVGCLSLWSNLSARVMAQAVGQPSAHPPIATPSTTPGVNNIDQIVVPAAEDVPEEILRTEIIFEARSPLDGASLSPADYAQLQAELATSQTTPTLNADIRFLIFLLQARRAFKPVIPFLP